MGFLCKLFVWGYVLIFCSIFIGNKTCAANVCLRKRSIYELQKIDKKFVNDTGTMKINGKYFPPRDVNRENVFAMERVVKRAKESRITCIFDKSSHTFTCHDSKNLDMDERNGGADSLRFGGLNWVSNVNVLFTFWNLLFFIIAFRRVLVMFTITYLENLVSAWQNRSNARFTM